MVMTYHKRAMDSRMLANNKTFPLNQNMTRPNYGIYLATGAIYNQQYVGQTTNKFSTRWSVHRSAWNKPDNGDDTGLMALSCHYSVPGILNKPPSYDSCTVNLVKQPSFNSLYTCEDTWFNKLNAKIYIQCITLPRVILFFLPFAVFIDFAHSSLPISPPLCPDLFYEVFPKQKWKCFWNENKFFWNEKCLYIEDIGQIKVFLKRK